MRHPWQTDTFDPSDPELLKRVHGSRRLHEGFHIGATSYEMDGPWRQLDFPLNDN